MSKRCGLRSEFTPSHLRKLNMYYSRKGKLTLFAYFNPITSTGWALHLEGARNRNSLFGSSHQFPNIIDPKTSVSVINVSYPFPTIINSQIKDFRHIIFLFPKRSILILSFFYPFPNSFPRQFFSKYNFNKKPVPATLVKRFYKGLYHFSGRLASIRTRNVTAEKVCAIGCFSIRIFRAWVIRIMDNMNNKYFGVRISREQVICNHAMKTWLIR